MLASQEELLRKLRLGKDSFFDFKEVRTAGRKVKSPTMETLADEMAAFVNSVGGVLLLGVNDGREVIGIPEEHLEAMGEMIQKACQQSIRPPLAPVIENYSQAARNEVLTSLLARCVVPQNKKSYTKRACMMDKRGEGVTLILNRCAALSEKRPEYRMLDSSELRVTIYGGNCQQRPLAFSREKLLVVKAENSDF